MADRDGYRDGQHGDTRRGERGNGERKMEINERRGQANRPIGDLSFRNAGFRTALYMYGIMLATLLPAVYCTPYHTPFPYPVGPMIVRTNLAETIQLLDTRHGSRHRSKFSGVSTGNPGTIREEIDLLVVSSSPAVVPERAQWKHGGCELFFGRTKARRTLLPGDFVVSPFIDPFVTSCPRIFY